MPRAAVLSAVLALLANCAAPDTTQGTGKLSDLFATPEWAKFNNSKPTAQQRAITPDDLVSADGRCAGTPDVVTAQATPEGANAPETASDAQSGQGAIPPVLSGIALAMTECQVVQRTGFPDRVDIGAEGGTRVTTVTVTHGTSPGLYRFRGGRLVSIERVDVPAPARPAKSTKAKKSSQAPIRGTQQ
ncbi:hypothetical protein [Pseudorhodoplanes sinuspersici]|uniref:Uncharacterized protein n=1 Tax=Pseudorhodoplanes sinuspersici TaxID=1235591 RepID=A0A1W6ZXK7_9HYPH|nr:hypothetical protein [Pseudorhodoplanes sinuspersici]ARQ02127.1 hypothetical protein CAK95_25780 [Pseudorhodoplanes sinuspersici]RKE73932.1 hypothetical protein DFP91_1831 [Pseudorhodoplanes sinuspersici]